MSGARPPRLSNTNNSTHIRGLWYHLTCCCMFFSQLLGISTDFNQMLQDGVIAVPLDAVGAAHKSAVLGSSTIIMPEVEVFESDGLIEGRSGKHAVLAQAVHDCFSGEDFFVGGV